MTVPRPRRFGVDAGSRRRTFSLLADPSPTPAPVLLLLHGSNQTGRSFRRFSRAQFDELADRGWRIAYLDGYRGGWNDARRSTPTAARRDVVDDVGFVRAVIDRLVAEHGGDPERIHVAGYSAGGSMVVRLIHELGDRLSTATLISAAQPTPDNLLLDADVQAAVPVTQLHGTDDRFVPYTGGVASLRGFFPRGTVLSAPDTAEYFARRAGVVGPPIEREVAADVGETRYERPGHPAVRLLTVRGGGHTVPGGRGGFPTGPATRSIRAVDVVAESSGS